MTTKKRKRAARKSEAACSVWVIMDVRQNCHTLGSGMAFSSEAVAQSFCRLPGDRPFMLHMIHKARRPALTPNARPVRTDGTPRDGGTHEAVVGSEVDT